MSSSPQTYDVAIIGSGPAGDTAAIYCQRAGLKIILITGYSIGGQLTTTTVIENFPGFPNGIQGGELMDRMLEQVKALKCEILEQDVVSIDFNIDNSNVHSIKTSEGISIHCNSVIICTGAHPRYLSLENEDKMIGNGVSVCATCDGFFFKNKTVCVIGGGNTAAIEALHLSMYANKVYIIYRGSKFNKMENTMIERLNKDNKIEFLFNSEVVEYIPNDKGKLKAVKIKHKNDDGNFDFNVLELNGVFLAIGKEPNAELFKNKGLDMDERGYIITKPDSTRTNIKGVYACGDVANKWVKQAVFAAGQGCLAALEVQQDHHSI